MNNLTSDIKSGSLSKNLAYLVRFVQESLNREVIVCFLLTEAILGQSFVKQGPFYFQISIYILVDDPPPFFLFR